MYSPYSFGMNLRVVQHDFQGVVPAGFFVQSWQNFGHKFRDIPYNINCWDNRTVYGFLVQKSRSKATGMSR
jgi:hypothetical protein